MAKRKLVALACLSMLSALLVSTTARAAEITTTIRAQGLIADNTGSTTTMAHAVLTIPDQDPTNAETDPDDVNDPLQGKPVVFKIGDKVICDGSARDEEGNLIQPNAITDSIGIARCGMLLSMPDFLAAGAHYSASFLGEVGAYTASTDTGSLYWHASSGDILP